MFFDVLMVFVVLLLSVSGSFGCRCCVVVRLRCVFYRAFCSWRGSMCVLGLFLLSARVFVGDCVVNCIIVGCCNVCGCVVVGFEHTCVSCYGLVCHCVDVCPCGLPL